MSNLYQAKVGQKLLHARQVLEMAAEFELLGPDRQKHQALVESALFHLILARDFYLCELLHDQNVIFTPPLTLESAAALVAEQHKQSSEFNELVRLAGDTFSWWTNISKHYQAIGLAEHSSVESSSSTGEQVINLTNLDSGASKLDLDGLRLWLAKFVALVERHRQVSSEC